MREPIANWRSSLLFRIGAGNAGTETSRLDGLLVERAEVDGRVVDVRIAGGRITAMGERLRAAAGEGRIDAAGGALLPGLHDHHLHLLALAASYQSVPVGPPAVTGINALAAALRSADRDLPGRAWLRGTGYHESVAGDLDRDRLDALVSDRPVRVQHRSGILWVLNSPALVEIGADRDRPPGLELDAAGRATGRLFRLDDWLRDRIPAEVPDLGAVGRALLGYGVTGVTDATPTDRPGDFELLAAAGVGGQLPQRIVVTGGLGMDAAAGAALERGPVKLVVGDDALPGLDDLSAWMETAHRRGRPVAVHCVTLVAALLALAAWDQAGPAPGDRMEHGAVLGPAEAARLAAHRITVVTQPNFIAERGDRDRAEVDPADLPHLWPCAGLLGAGVPVGGGTDAPFGHPDPWRAMAAAVERRTAGGAVLGPDERLDPARALALFLSPAEFPGGPPRRVAVGAAADLCLLRVPRRQALQFPTSEHVAATVCAVSAGRPLR